MKLLVQFRIGYHFLRRASSWNSDIHLQGQGKGRGEAEFEGDDHQLSRGRGLAGSDRLDSARLAQMLRGLPAGRLGRKSVLCMQGY